MINHFFKIISIVNHKTIKAKIIYMCFILYERTLTFIIMTYSRVISTKCKLACTLRRTRNFLYLSFLSFRFFLTVKDFVDARFYNDNISFFNSFESTLRTASEKFFLTHCFRFLFFDSQYVIDCQRLSTE